MVQKVARMFAGIRWDAATVGRFLGRYLSEPKAHIVFDRPARPLGLLAFQRRVEARGVRLALASLMLSRGDTVYLNGEATTPPKRFLPLFVALADARALPKGTRLEGAALEALHGYYLSGYLVFER
jgi:50S ribosomal protein L16 3-hydroxylase